MKNWRNNDPELSLTMGVKLIGDTQSPDALQSSTQESET